MTRKLHIGGQAKSEGWEILNAINAPYVDHVGNANDLSRFADNTFDEIYASHVLEHLDFNGELQSTLKEWNRVLTPSGKFFVSVPNLDILARLFIDSNRLTIEERYFVMTMIFGAHTDKYDYHVVGLNGELLSMFLNSAGFVDIRTVDNFGIFSDTSSMQFKGVAISLNMIAKKRQPP